MAEILDILVQLVVTLFALVVAVGTLAVRNGLLIAWVAWWLWGVNWTKAWGVLARGGWMVAVLLVVLAAMVWAAVAPSRYDVLGLFQVPNFWWQLTGTTLLALVALFCGWVQGVFHWEPAEVNLEPPAPAHADHGHGHH